MNHRVSSRLSRSLSLIFLASALLLGAAAASAEDANPQVVMETSKGTIVIELLSQEAPISTANFLAYVDASFFDGTIFHRVIPNFMIQGGGFTADMTKKPTRDPIQNEADNGVKNERGTLAMARTNEPNSATGQFFINTVDNTFLNHTGKNVRGWGYAVFAKVVSGMEVVDAIAAVRTGSKNGMGDVPVEPVTIIKAYRKTAAKADAG